jgi:pimeloyl-ACP methyl ester carboxylesterase
MKCETDTATIAWEEHGEGQPIVFLHGWTMNRRSRSTSTSRSSRTRRLAAIYPDLPGMGLSVAKAIRNQDDVLARCSPSSTIGWPGAPSCWPARRSAAISRARIAARRREQSRPAAQRAGDHRRHRPSGRCRASSRWCATRA